MSAVLISPLHFTLFRHMNLPLFNSRVLCSCCLKPISSSDIPLILINESLLFLLELELMLCITSMTNFDSSNSLLFNLNWLINIKAPVINNKVLLVGSAALAISLRFKWMELLPVCEAVGFNVGILMVI